MIDNILKMMNIEGVIDVIQFNNYEDDSKYEVWKVITNNNVYVLKKAKKYELTIYNNFLNKLEYGVPRLYLTVNYNNEDYILIEYILGDVLNKCDRTSLIKAVDTLIKIQDHYWQNDKYNNIGFTYDKSIEGRIKRKEYLNNIELEKQYEIYLDIYSKIPKTLCHDDLLPFNVIANEKSATIIDWEYAGMLPYLSSISRLIAHSGENEEFFFMKEEDKAFIIDYYFKNFIINKGIKYNDYIYSLKYFILYEYTEWIMLGNKYDTVDKERFNMYQNKTIKLIENLNSK
jgi:thiamine kinase-like enzyme